MMMTMILCKKYNVVSMHFKLVVGSESIYPTRTFLISSFILENLNVAAVFFTFVQTVRFLKGTNVFSLGLKYKKLSACFLMVSFMLTPATVILFLETAFCNVSEVALKFQFLSLINGLIFNSLISNLLLLKIKQSLLSSHAFLTKSLNLANIFWRGWI